MDVTPKSKQPGSLKRRPATLSKSARTKLLKVDVSNCDSSGKADVPEDGENAPAVIQPQQYTPVRRISSQNEESPKYPHMFRIFHDESPEITVSWNDGMSETVPPRKEKSIFDSSSINRSMMSQHLQRPLKKFSTPPSLKQKPVTADVAEYMQWAQSLVEKAKSFLAQSSSSNATSSIEPSPRIESGDGSCENSKDVLSCDSGQILMIDSKSLPSSNNSPPNSDFSCSTRNNSVADRFSLPSSILTHNSTNRNSLPSSDSNYSDMFDDSANDDMFMRCSQAVEDSLLKNNSNARQSLSTNSVNSNANYPHNEKKFSSSTPQVCSKVSQANPLSFTNQAAKKNHSFVSPNNIPTTSKFQARSSEGLSAVSNIKVPTDAMNHYQKRNSTEAFVSKPSIIISKLPASSSASLSSSSSSSLKDSGIDIQLLDEDDDFLCSVDLQSLSQINPQSSNLPIHSTKKDSHFPSSTVICTKSSTSALKPLISTANSTENTCSSGFKPKGILKPNISSNISVLKPNSSLDVNARNPEANVNVKVIKPVTGNINCTVNSLGNKQANGKICSQDAINKKRLEAQRRLQSKMQRHLTM